MQLNLQVAVQHEALRKPNLSIQHATLHTHDAMSDCFMQVGRDRRPLYSVMLTVSRRFSVI